MTKVKEELELSHGLLCRTRSKNVRLRVTGVVSIGEFWGHCPL